MEITNNEKYESWLDIICNWRNGGRRREEMRNVINGEWEVVQTCIVRGAKAMTLGKCWCQEVMALVLDDVICKSKE